MHSITPSRQAGGFSLIELMISITIGLLLIAAMATLIANNSAQRQEMEKSSRQIENGRYAMQVLFDDLRHAGYYGEYYQLGTVPGALPDPCATGTSALASAMPLPIQGYDAPTTVPAPLSACLSDADHVSGTDILVVRRAATVTSTTLTAGRIYMQTISDNVLVNNGSALASTWTLANTKNGTPSAAPIYQFIVHVYFISPCSVPASGSSCTGAADDGGKPIPTLKRLELTNTGTTPTMSIVPLVEGIENLQIDYGIDNNGIGAPDTYVMNPSSTTDWSNVVAARVNLVARNVETTIGFVDKKQYSLGMAGTFTPATSVKAYRRHAFSQLVRLENPSSRREQ